MTCEWWSNIWLNEGFATYIASLSQCGAVPAFDTRREMLYDTVQNALSYDIGRNAPILNSAETIFEVDNVFGTITYDKGGSIIRMMEGFLGNDTLIKGLIAYLDRHKYTGVHQDQLFEVLDEFAHDDNKLPAGVTVKDIMDTWTLQSGYPLIRVSKVSSNRLAISQEEYRPVSAAAVSDPLTALDEDDLWEVPITISNENNVGNNTPALWLNKNVALRTYEIDTTKWLVVNVDAMGYYRVLYDPTILELIHTKLSTDLNSINALNRAQFIDDYFSFYKLGYTSVDKALDFTKYLKTDPDHIVWYTAMYSMSSWVTLLSETSQDFKDYMNPRLEVALRAVQDDFDSTDEGSSVIFRAKLYDWANSLQNQYFQGKAQDMVNNWIADSSKVVRLDYQSFVYCSAVASSGDEVFDFFLAKYKDSTTAESDKTKYLNALACSNDPRFHELILDETEIRSADAALALDRSARNSAVRTGVTNFLRIADNFNYLKASTNGTTFLNTILTTISSFTTEESIRDILLTIVTQYEADLTSAQGLRDAINNNYERNKVWLEGEGLTVKEWFTANVNA